MHVVVKNGFYTHALVLSCSANGLDRVLNHLTTTGGIPLVKNCKSTECEYSNYVFHILLPILRFCLLISLCHVVFLCKCYYIPCLAIQTESGNSLYTRAALTTHELEWLEPWSKLAELELKCSNRELVVGNTNVTQGTYHTLSTYITAYRCHVFFTISNVCI